MHRGDTVDTALHRDRSAAFSPWVEESYHRLTQTLRAQTPVPPRLREAAIRRALSRSVSSYELARQEAAALEAGLTRPELEMIETPRLAYRDGADPELQALMRYIDEFSVGRYVQKESFSTLQRSLNAPQIIGLSLQAGFWNAAGHFASALKLQPEEFSLSDHHELAAGEAVMPPIMVEPGEKGGRLGLPVPSALLSQAFEAWPGGPGAVPTVLKAWAWLESPTLAAIDVWQQLCHRATSLGHYMRGMVVRRTLWRNGAYQLLDASLPGHRKSGLNERMTKAIEGGSLGGLISFERRILQFVDLYDSGLPIGDELFRGVFRRLDRQAMVELMLTVDFFGLQARLATALELPAEAAAVAETIPV